MVQLHHPVSYIRDEICVFCSSSQTVHPIYFEEARQLSHLIAKDKHHLVLGGANIGIMGELAHAVKKNGAKVIGVMPKKLVNMERAYRDADEFIQTKICTIEKRPWLI